LSGRHQIRIAACIAPAFTLRTTRNTEMAGKTQLAAAKTEAPLATAAGGDSPKRSG